MRIVVLIPVLIAGAMLVIPPVIASEEYDPVGKRDPFEPTIEKSDDPCTPERPALCADVSDMKLEGVISGISDARALVALPGGERVMVERGDAIGRHAGQVVALRQSAIVVVERTGDGGFHETVLHVEER